MAAASDYLENKLLDHVLRNVAYTSPTTVYLALYTAAPSDAGGGTEVSGGSYARQAVTFDAAAAGATANSADVDFADMPAVTVTHWGIFDAVTAGNLLIHGAFDSSQTYAAADTARVALGDLDITLA